MIGTWVVGGAFVQRARGLKAVNRAVPCLWVLGVICWELLTPHETEVVPLLAAAPAIACASSGRRRCILLLGGASLLFALAPPTALEPDGDAEEPHAGLVSCGAILAVAVASYLTGGRRLRLVRELEQMRAVATAAQDAVLRPLPARLEGIEVAGGYLSASRGAVVGGDLYEVLATPHGVRVIIGDARGHGLAAISTVAAVLGSFREAAHDEPELAGVLRRLDRALQRHLRERALGDPPAGEEPGTPVAEEFVTVLLLEVGPDGETTALNCGHPWPYLLSEEATGAPRIRRPALGEVLPPLGPFPLPADLPAARCAPLHPGDTLFLHTDGAEDARDAQGRFFPLGTALAEAAGPGPIVPAALVTQVREAVLRHTGGRLADDIALLALSQESKPGQPPGHFTPRAN
ncbi:PP2C family protein-serine/threonine phosphatase [Streptomyces sparsogenes]|uniref:Magnesium or manganese-dependent protein phosphatase n=1 Tax=Streptomyces sparsogenes DSM 40356 TaxID=1331668 RepID=A0A1R1SSY4_9ACTN|nr:PP2C family protein-serine/threonine phosphatase [Streptomyces sparsogenes]OMI41404.1 magnesium or manganese-dependent protein phosphatase [Streptomyces sparsogenes DSM 40356]